MNRNGVARGVLVNNASLHHKYDSSNRHGVFQWITIERDEVRLQLRRNGADLVCHAERFRADGICGHHCLHRENHAHTKRGALHRFGNLEFRRAWQCRWCRGPESNWLRPPFQGGALPMSYPGTGDLEIVGVMRTCVNSVKNILQITARNRRIPSSSCGS